MSHAQRFRTYRTVILILSILMVPLGLATKAYHGPLSGWVYDYAGDVVYEAFWILLGVFIWPNVLPVKVASAVFIITSAIEFLQLWQPAFLQAFRATTLGRLLLGTTFVWWDFPHYFIGCVLTWLLVRYLKSKLVPVREETPSR
ncbi:MAG: DUF2809 domain-containing protein [Microcoleus vaginatus WJT46-NPBG5]|jgi:hypothetical protein|nr:DUF2809 domain-containing protein [Microcoleus vaginatus WJT46-NPBG5]